MVALKIAFVWVISIVICIPLCIMGYMDYSNVYNNNNCFPAIKEFVLYGSIFAFFIPLGIMVVTKTVTIRMLCTNQLMAKFVQDQTRSARCGQAHLSQEHEVGNSYLSHESIPSLVDRSSFDTSLSFNASINEMPLPSTSDSNSDKRKSAISEGEEFAAVEVREGEGGGGRSGQPGDAFSVKTCQVHCISHRALSFPTTFGRTHRKYTINMAARLDGHEKSTLHGCGFALTDREQSISKRTAIRERKASKVLGIIFAVFVVLWTPFFIVNILPAVCLPCVAEVTPHIMAAITWLGYLSSFTNPIIYTMFNVDFRRAFHRILTCGYRRQITETPT